MFDCASFYKNEEVVGQAFVEMFKSGITREELYIISKVWFDEVEDVEAACRRSLKKLGVDYLDMYLVHWPIAVRAIEVEGQETKYEKIKFPMYKVWA